MEAVQQNRAVVTFSPSLSLTNALLSTNLSNLSVSFYRAATLLYNKEGMLSQHHLSF